MANVKMNNFPRQLSVESHNAVESSRHGSQPCHVGDDEPLARIESVHRGLCRHSETGRFMSRGAQDVPPQLRTIFYAPPFKFPNVFPWPVDTDIAPLEPKWLGTLLKLNDKTRMKRPNMDKFEFVIYLDYQRAVLSLGYQEIDWWKPGAYLQLFSFTSEKFRSQTAFELVKARSFQGLVAHLSRKKPWVMEFLENGSLPGLTKKLSVGCQLLKHDISTLPDNWKPIQESMHKWLTNLNKGNYKGHIPNFLGYAKVWPVLEAFFTRNMDQKPMTLVSSFSCQIACRLMLIVS